MTFKFKSESATAQDKEKGAVLLMTLLVMSLMASLAVAMIDVTRTSIKRTGNLAASAQMDWYAKGIEDFARLSIEQRLSAMPARDIERALAAAQPMLLPIEGGLISISIRDGSDCFSLGRLSNATGQSQFKTLLALRGADIDKAQSLAALAADWADTDMLNTPNGGEDYLYLGQASLPHRTANTSFSSVMELRVLPGMTEELYQSVRPFVCARPSGVRSVVNVNGLEPWQAPLLAAILGSADYLDLATTIIRERPARGYSNVGMILGSPALQNTTLAGLDLQALSIETQQIWIEADITYLNLKRTIVLDYALDDEALTRTYRGLNDESRRPVLGEVLQ